MIAEKLSIEANSRRLGIFAKYWEPGKVKTRLASSIGEVNAARIYEVFVAATIARLSSIESERLLAYSPADEKTHLAFANANIDGWSLKPQTSGDLGQRMAAYFDQQFAAGADRVLLLGTDSPNVPLVEVQEAFEHLNTSDVVLGPTEDGGYYLVGAKGQTPPIFENIAWSTPKVLPATVECLKAANLSYATLDPWYDVDEIFDLHRLIEDLRDDCASDAEPALEILLNHVLEVIES